MSVLARGRDLHTMRLQFQTSGSRATGPCGNICGRAGGDAGVPVVFFQETMENEMTQARYATLTLILSVVAAALAVGAAVIRYLSDGEIRWSLIAAGAFILVFGLGARGRITSKE